MATLRRSPLLPPLSSVLRIANCWTMVNGVTIPEYLPNGSNVSPLTDSNLGHCTTRGFTDLRISRHHRVSPVYFELIILDSFPDLSISASLPCISNATSWSFWELCISRSPALSLGLLISRYLD